MAGSMPVPPMVAPPGGCHRPVYRRAAADYGSASGDGQERRVGAWGPGVLDSDGAWDYVGELLLSPAGGRAAAVVGT
jgi:hypothetical protein